MPLSTAHRSGRAAQHVTMSAEAAAAPQIV